MAAATVLEWLLWAAVLWAVFLAYAAVDVPMLVVRWKRGQR